MFVLLRIYRTEHYSIFLQIISSFLCGSVFRSNAPPAKHADSKNNNQCRRQQCLHARPTPRPPGRHRNTPPGWLISARSCAIVDASLRVLVITRVISAPGTPYTLVFVAQCSSEVYSIRMACGAAWRGTGEENVILLSGRFFFFRFYLRCL